MNRGCPGDYGVKNRTSLLLSKRRNPRSKVTSRLFKTFTAAAIHASGMSLPASFPSRQMRRTVCHSRPPVWHLDTRRPEDRIEKLNSDLDRRGIWKDPPMGNKPQKAGSNHRQHFEPPSCFALRQCLFEPVSSERVMRMVAARCCDQDVNIRRHRLPHPALSDSTSDRHPSQDHSSLDRWAMETVIAVLCDCRYEGAAVSPPQSERLDFSSREPKTLSP